LYVHSFGFITEWDRKIEKHYEKKIGVESGVGIESHSGIYTDTVRINMSREGEGGCEIDEQPCR